MDLPSNEVVCPANGEKILASSLENQWPTQLVSKEHQLCGLLEGRKAERVWMLVVSRIVVSPWSTLLFARLLSVPIQSVILSSLPDLS